MIKKWLKRLKQRSPKLFFWYTRQRFRLKMILIPDSKFIRQRYHARHGVYPDLAHPSKYSEHVVRILATPPPPLKALCADKYAVRAYVRDKIGDHVLNELYGVYEDYETLQKQLLALPDRFVVKATHGAAWNFICHNKAQLNEKELKAKASHWLRSNFYHITRELVYKHIPPRIICEKYLEDESGGLTDYKVYCFCGEPKFMHMVLDRYKGMIYNTYDTEGNFLDLDFMGREDRNVGLNPDLPLHELIDYCRKLSRGFDYVRVDFYFVGGKLVFGELTFTPGSGNYGLPVKEDLYLGRLFDDAQFNLHRNLPDRSDRL